MLLGRYEMDLNNDRSTELPLVEKLLPLWIILCMAAGLLIGKLINASQVQLLPAVTAIGQIISGKFTFDLGHTLSLGIPVGLFLMIYPAMAKIHMEDARKALGNGRAIGIVIFFSFLVGPFLLWILGQLFLSHYPELWISLILLGVAPCIAMVLVWTDLAGGNNALALTIMVVNSLIQMVMTPILIFVIIGARIPLDIGLIAESIVLYLGLPLVAGIITRNRLIKSRGHEWFVSKFVPVINKVQFGALLFTLVVMFSLKGDVVIAKPELIPLMAVPLTLYFIVIFFLAFSASRLFKLKIHDRIAVAFNATGNNFELSIAIALSAFAAQKMVGVGTVIGPLIEVPVMLLLVSRAKRALAKSKEAVILTTQQEVYEDDSI